MGSVEITLILRSVVNRVQIVLYGLSVRLLCVVHAFFYVGMVVCMSWLHLCLYV